MKNTIKIWPNLSDISQAIIPYSDSKINFDKIVHIDMSNILDINSSGVTLTLLKLAKLIKQNKHTRWSIIEPNVAIKSFIESVGFNNILSERIGNKDMFWTIKDVNQTSSFEQVNQQGLITHSFPIYYLNHTKNEHRISVEDFIDWVLLVLEDYSITYNFHLHIFLKLLKEIAKNSEDHTSDNAFFGMDLIKYPYSNKAQLLFFIL
jgi:ABC-type transporter Mla MlaB component